MNSETIVKDLISKHVRLIESEASKYASFVPLSVVRAEAYRIAHKAAQDFDTKAGIQFSTFLHNSLKKLSRISTMYGAAVRIPEASQFKLQKLNQVEAALHDDLGRTPTLQELAANSGFSLQEVANLLKTRKKEVNINNMSHTPVFMEGEDDDWVHFVYHDLNESDRFIFEHKTGFGGRKVLTNEEIAEQLKVSPSTVANRVKIISGTLAKGV